MSKVDVATVKRVTKDWAALYPGFDVWRPMRLLRRIGPVLQGVTLDRSTSGDAYFPTAHIHALTREFPVISLTLGQRLVTSSGVQEAVTFSRHAEDYSGAAGRLAEQARLSLDLPPTVEDVVRELRAIAVSQQAQGGPPAVNEVEDSVLIPAASGSVDISRESIQLARELLKKWPKSRLPINWTSADEWLEGVSEKAGNVDSLHEIIDGQIAFHKLSKVRQE
ncbi:hypothetical protein P1S61_19595 [Streptomyces sp. ME08-AFT2]|uniref:hypothetical protein n=1 Tax=unclassified Streptomyces TaxID=2593676 RepID=UPI0029AAA1D5|nr:hypothetical protein [Streptomyces sp. ME08-AFT2]MDX3311229.1 hypothetical protein [Streptomyces sp. ME08-AFT2]